MKKSIVLVAGWVTLALLGWLILRPLDSRASPGPLEKALIAATVALSIYTLVVMFRKRGQVGVNPMAETQELGTVYHSLQNPWH